VEQELLKILKKEEPDDPDKSFFLSLYGDFCKLPDHMKVHTKLKLQQVLCTAVAESAAEQLAIGVDLGQMFHVVEQ